MSLNPAPHCFLPYKLAELLLRPRDLASARGERERS
jgi:hypothetical protein